MGSHKAKWKKETSHTAGPAEPDSLGPTRQSPLPQAAPILRPISILGEGVGGEESTRRDLGQHQNFTPRDFTCQCAGLCDPSGRDLTRETVAKLDQICDVIGLPIKVLSGTRCERYNTRVSGKGRRPPPEGWIQPRRALSCPDSSFRFAFLAAALPVFNRIGIGKDFIHVDDDPELPPKAVWIAENGYPRGSPFCKKGLPQPPSPKTSIYGWR